MEVFKIGFFPSDLHMLRDEFLNTPNALVILSSFQVHVSVEGAYEISGLRYKLLPFNLFFEIGREFIAIRQLKWCSTLAKVILLNE